VDFSDAQRLGFINAFEDYFFGQEDNIRTRDELRLQAQSLLKGCRYHFDKSVTRVSRISSCVPSSTIDLFVDMCRQLCTTENAALYERLVELMGDNWPMLKPWMDWWFAPDHAMMIFPSQRKMDKTLASKLPGTTNAEESIHQVIYTIAGGRKA
jgi:hypothetical protein